MDCMYYGCIDMYLHVLVGISTYYVLVCMACMALLVGMACIGLDLYWCAFTCIGMYDKYCMYSMFLTVFVSGIVCSVCINIDCLYCMY